MGRGAPRPRWAWLRDEGEDVRHDKEMVGEVMVLRPRERRLDAAMAPALRACLIETIDAGRRKIVLDLAAVDFIDSSGLGAIISALKHLGGDGELAVTNLAEPIRSLFSLTRMDRLFPIYATAEEAAAALAKIKGSDP